MHEGEYEAIGKITVKVEPSPVFIVFDFVKHSYIHKYK